MNDMYTVIGKVPSSTDPYFLHVLPVLQLDPYDGISTSDIHLDVRASWCVTTIAPGELSIIAPYPNQNFCAGGSSECDLGWLVPLPEDIEYGSITMEWQLTPSTPSDQHVTKISHTINLDFEYGKRGQRVWSMDIANYWQQTRHADIHPEPRIALNRFSHYRAAAISKDRHAVVYETAGDTGRQLTITEQLTLPAIDIDECWTIQRYGGVNPQTLLAEAS
ncbi:hypothetical protein [Carnimonas bestiolae]|uniref:hypothetical protein n=1 Tax=Carnimonas bestiolae TaxID=3402172 RepID=UPI003EDC6958